MYAIEISILTQVKNGVSRYKNAAMFLEWWSQEDHMQIHPLAPYDRFIEYRAMHGKKVISRLIFQNLLRKALKYCHKIHEEKYATQKTQTPR